MKALVTPVVGLMCLVALAMSACVRDKLEDCPPLQVRIEVKDKNYFNVDQVEAEERLSEDLPFRKYVPTLYWVLRDPNTGAVVDESPLITVSGDEKTVTPNICPCVPYGKYVLTVWGGLDSRDGLNEDLTLLQLHPGNSESHDVYLTNDTLLYDAWHNDYTVELERTNGKLIIEKSWERLPGSVDGVSEEICGVYARVDNAFRYSGTTCLETHVWKPVQEKVSKTVLAPSLVEYGTKVHLDFVDMADPSVPPLTVPDVSITLRRNELTVLRYVWDSDRQDFVIYVLLNNSWILINQMDIEEN